MLRSPRSSGASSFTSGADELYGGDGADELDAQDGEFDDKLRGGPLTDTCLYDFVSFNGIISSDDVAGCNP